MRVLLIFLCVLGANAIFAETGSHAVNPQATPPHPRSEPEPSLEKRYIACLEENIKLREAQRNVSAPKGKVVSTMAFSGPNDSSSALDDKCREQLGRSCPKGTLTQVTFGISTLNLSTGKVTSCAAVCQTVQ